MNSAMSSKMSSRSHTLDGWGSSPDSDMRKRKSQMEEELLIKLGAKKEMIEFHPLILATKLERARSSASLKYTRLQRPKSEVMLPTRNVWSCDDPALRQISTSTRHGPRDIILPNLIRKLPECRANEILPYDVEYHMRRAAITERLSQILGDWTVYHKLVFPPPQSKRATTVEIERQRRLSKGTLHDIGQGRPGRPTSSSTGSNGKTRATEAVPKRSRRRNRWREMAQEIFLNVKSAQMRLPQELPRSELRIYVSSTPDFREEREFLSEVAYPKLKELCEKMGLNCHVVDMRNGAGVLANDVETFDLIEKEVYTCKRVSIGPCFVSILGHSIDDHRLPGFLTKDVYEKIRDVVLREKLVGLEELDDMYRLDSNRVPGVYVKQPTRVTVEYETVESVEDRLLTALTKGVSILQSKELSEEDKNNIQFYKWSGVVKEVEEGLLSSYCPRSDTLCFMLDAERAQKEPAPNCTDAERLRYRVWEHYREFASKNNMIGVKSPKKKSLAYLRSLADTFVSGIVSLLKAQMRHREYDVAQQLTEGSEALQHVRLALREAENNSGTERIMERVKELVGSDNCKTILLWGNAGSGKTAIASHVAKASVIWEPRRKVIFRCMGVTLRSSSLFRVLESLIRQINFIYSMTISLPEDVTLQEMVATFCHTINCVSTRRTMYGDLFLVLDQLDRLPDVDAHLLLCILNSLSEGITLLVTLQSPHNLISVLKSHPAVKTVLCEPVEEDVMAAHITKSLEENQRVVTHDQLHAFTKSVERNSCPLYTQLGLHLLKWWPSHTLQEIAPLSGDLKEDLVLLLNEIENDLGKAFTRYALSYLATARHGLAESELLHLLSKDAHLLDEIEEEGDAFISVVEGFPYQLQLSRLISRLGNFLVEMKMEGETVHQIVSCPLRECITSQYMSDDFLFTVHHKLADFFLFIRRGLLLSSKDISEQKHKHFAKYQWRTLRCVPYHLCFSSADTAQVWSVLKEKVFFNFSWLVNEVYLGFFNDLLEDITFALNVVSLDPDIQYLQQLLISVRHTVIHNPLSLAAVFSSQNVDKLHNVKDNVRVVVEEARDWLKQVHLQALVPVSYTSDKDVRLFMKENGLTNVTDVQIINDTGTLLVQRGRSLSIVNLLTCEEVPLATLAVDIQEIHVCAGEYICVLTSGLNEKTQVELFSLEKGKHINSVTLTESPLIWFKLKNAHVAYFADSKGVRSAELEQGVVSRIISPKSSWSQSYLSACRTDKIILVRHKNKITEVDIFPVKEPENFRRVSFHREPENTHCTQVLSTKDDKYVVYVTEREAKVIDGALFSVLYNFSCNGLPIVVAELSRSHEHVFMAYASGAVTCHVLYSGNETMNTKVRPKAVPKHVILAKGRDGKQVKKLQKGTETNPQTDMITCLLTSEDDHFLLCGTNGGHVYIIHVPTGHQVVAITTKQREIIRMMFCTDKGHFQHFITLDDTGVSHQWNLRPLIKQARILVHPYITDEDLIKEEEQKLDLSAYYGVFQSRKTNRVFLNGPDIAAFFKDTPLDIFTPLTDLDPAFGVQNDWEFTGSLENLSEQLLAIACGHELSDIMLTVTTDFRLARWSLQDGSLLWTKFLPRHGGVGVHEIASVYFDQAVLVAEQSESGTFVSLTVIYTGEGNQKILSRSNVRSYWTSLDRTKVMMQCQGQGQEPDFLVWDLINSKEELWEVTKPPTNKPEPKSKDAVALTTMTRDLSLCLRLAVSEPLPPTGRHSADVHRYSREGQTRSEVTSAKEATRIKGRDSSVDSVGSFDIAGDVDRYQMSSRRSRYGDADVRSLSARSSIIATPLHEAIQSIKTPRQDTDDNIDRQETKEHETIVDETNHIERQQSEIDSQRSRNLGHHSKTDFSGNVHTTVHCCAIRPRPTPSPEPSHLLPPPMQPNLNPRKSSSARSNPKSRKSRTPSPRQESPQPDVSNTENQITESKTPPPAEELIDFKLRLNLRATSVCVCDNHDIVIGTDTGHVIILSGPEEKTFSVLGWDDSSEFAMETTRSHLVTKATSPHKQPVTYLANTDDGSVLISSDGFSVVLWRIRTQRLLMNIRLDKNQQILHMVVSKDASVVAVATDGRTLSLWSPLVHREIANYMTPFDILDLHMTSDCRKLIVQGQGHEAIPVLEVFEVKNIDDILMKVDSRKKSQHDQTMESLKDERKRKTSQRVGGGKEHDVEG